MTPTARRGRRRRQNRLDLVLARQNLRSSERWIQVLLALWWGCSGSRYLMGRGLSLEAVGDIDAARAGEFQARKTQAVIPPVRDLS